MSNAPDNEFNLDLHFLPAWAQQPASANKYAKYSGEEGPRERRPREGRGRGPRPDRPRPEGGGPRRRDVRGGENRRRFQPEAHGDRERKPEAPLPEVSVTLVPEEKGIDSLVKQIKMTGRAYPLFEIAHFILQKPERFQVIFSVVRGKEGQPVQALFHCALDETLWLSEEEAVAHVLEKHFATFYTEEKIPADPPKGTYTFVAQCGMSGVILGPPNYHNYQVQLRRLHQERFAAMPFESFKSRVKIVRDEAVVKKWIEEQSWKTEYQCLNLPDPLKLGSREEVENHFRKTHAANVIKKVDQFALQGAAARQLRSPGLQRLLRKTLDDQKRFPLKIVNSLSQQFAQRGLQFFKVNKTVIHVSVARPHYLDVTATPVSDGIRRIVDFIEAHPHCTRRQLFEAIVPGLPHSAEGSGTELPESPELNAAVADLHWLIHQGHVLEFANGLMETAKKPAAKPPQTPRPANGTPGVQAAAPPEPAPAPPADTPQVEAKPE